jgi:hypothetical protein
MMESTDACRQTSGMRTRRRPWVRPHRACRADTEGQPIVCPIRALRDFAGAVKVGGSRDAEKPGVQDNRVCHLLASSPPALGARRAKVLDRQVAECDGPDRHEGQSWVAGAGDCPDGRGLGSSMATLDEPGDGSRWLIALGSPAKRTHANA